ncbi:hypothetical protein [uncultured Methanoregula sp.]|uniref:hypothetical protein n=1 Tax=uncultured Methanoregula sp. TaxID=1005933 RepID=UPI002AAC05EF|nr:hypothetical protein [uncultured Methanoregula sp.]
MQKNTEEACRHQCNLKAYYYVSGLSGCGGGDTGTTGGTSGTGTTGGMAAAGTTGGTPASGTTNGWNWNTYTGVSSWNVRIIEDESRCEGGQVYTEDISVGIKHSGNTAVMTSVGHGPATGTFTSGNVLHFPSRTVSDPPGKSRLSVYDLTFTPDCSLMSGGYDWSYSGPTGSCSGSTGMRGYNENSAGCPAQPVTTVNPVVPLLEQPWAITHQKEIALAHSDLTEYLDLVDMTKKWQFAAINFDKPGGDPDTVDDAKAAIASNKAKITVLEPKVEAEYKTILTADPNNYFANMDMAELKKNQGNWNEYSYYIQKSLANHNLDEKTREFLKYDIATKNGFNVADLPTPEKSPILQKVSAEGSTIQKIYNQDVSKDASDPSRWSLERWTIFAPNKDVTNIVATVITN